MSLAVRPDGHANANLPRSFGHAHEFMMFMMPMPPTSNETRAIASSSTRHYVCRGARRFRDFFLRSHHEIIIVARSDLVALAQQIGDFLLRGVQRIRAGRFHHDSAECGCARQPFIIALV